MGDLRITVAVATVLRLFLEEETNPRYGYDLMQATGFPSGKIYPILARLQRAGLLARELETVEAAEAGRPPRTLYRLTPLGQTTAQHELAALSQQLRPPPRSAAARPGLRGKLA